MLFFNSQENKCIFGILSMLYREKSTYTAMFKHTKVSHITLQRALVQLQNESLIKKYDIGHKKVDYLITEKGTKVLLSLQGLKKIME